MAEQDAFPPPAFWYGFFSAIYGRPTEPPILDTGDAANPSLTARTTLYEQIIFSTVQGTTFFARQIAGQATSVWEFESPPAALSLFYGLAQDDLIRFDRPLTPRYGLVFHSLRATARAGSAPMRKQRLLLCDDGAVIVLLSEAKWLSSSEQLVEYSLGMVPVTRWWNFQCQASNVRSHVTRQPVFERLPVFEGTAGLAPATG